MLTKRDIYKLAYKSLENQRRKTQLLKEENFKKVIKVCPEIENLVNSLKYSSVTLIKSIFNRKNSNEIIFKIKQLNETTQEKIKFLLKKNNFPPNFLDLEPSCKICNDVGFVNNEQCSCLKKIVRKITINELQKDSCFRLTNFNSFNLNLYSKQKKTDDDISDFDQMNAIFNICKKFAQNFPNVGGGLIMFGLTGLGKTHLSLSIASELISKGFGVIYATASEIVRKMTDVYFKRTQVNEVKFLNLINETDLIILDDLGSEFESSLNLSAIFEILNIRTNLNKPIILSTNLFPKEIERRYGFRIFSRISANLLTLHFVGTDNRHNINN